ncbi:MAG TPA: PorP/SprF family type IX secretion system membrane protein [Saprospiraceae bacterium]|nr:PorP/SprF family type IX secretion system membrane protein [Saprospiraceae bacterium]
MKKFLLSVLFLSSLCFATAQDIHFSQFYASPLTLNPALTGVMNCNTRVTANYRSQWASVLNTNAFRTYSVSYDQKIPVGRSDYFGIGGLFWSDVAGQTDFGTVTGKLSLSYSKKMGGYGKTAHYLVVGANGGVSRRGADFLNATWGIQYDGRSGADTNIDPQENFNNNNFLFADMAAGLLWFSVLDDNSNFYVGAAMSHLNRANQSFNDDEFEALYTRFTGHAGGQFLIGRSLGLNPGIVVFSQGPSFQTNLGTNLRFLLGNYRRSNQAVQFGVWYRMANAYDGSGAANAEREEQLFASDALILTGRFDYESFSIGFSYDINVSDLAVASNGNGAFEFSLIYMFCGPEARSTYCPRF